MKKEMIESILNYSRAEQTEVFYSGEDTALTRFANNYIHQNVAERDANVSIRVVIGKKIGTASTNKLDEMSLKLAVDKAIEIARTQPENPQFVSLPSPSSYMEIDAFVPRTAEVSPVQRAEAVKIIVDEAQKKGVIASGAYSTSSYDLLIANSLGLFAAQKQTLAELNLVVTGDNGASGYASIITRDAADIDPKALANEAIEKCLKSFEPISIEPGDYTVILEPYAVGTLLSFLGYIGFGALSMQEGRSFMCDKIGQKITGENITIWDDALDPAGLPAPFDYEGVPKMNVMLIENGIAKGVVYDSYTAGIEGVNSTGHGLPAPNSFGPVPLNMFMKEGDSSIDEMIASTQKGVYVTRFHYTNVVEPMTTTITGLTRDGTFLIENGKITAAVKNLRFTNSILEALSNVSMISSETKLVEGFGGSRVPAIKVDSFTFSGTTDET
jgi:predicted Zn-dependent protease